tara:strand:- start:4529 stop:5383 length:855 start_codon:yes stop_codon:yes gene_type:complete
MFNILFIGIGNMGFPMAGYLSQKHKVTIFNRSKEKQKRWITEYNGEILDDLKSINKDYDFIISCVGNDSDLEEIINHSFDNLQKESVFIDHSTVSPETVIKLAKRLNGKSVYLLDAPVSGGQAGAENGALSIMVGGDLDAFKKSKPVMDLYGKKVEYMGDTGSGQQTKIINQICIGGLIQSLSEAIYFMKHTNLDPSKVLDVISSGAAQSWQMENRFKTMTEDKFDFGFAVDLMRKDLSIAFRESEKYGIDLEITKIIDTFYEDLQKQGHNNLDTSSLIKRLIK